MDTLRRDLRYALRSLRRSPGFAAAAVGTLALGIGANTAMFSALNALLLSSLPFPDAHRIVFGYALREGFDPFGTSLLEYTAYRDGAASFEKSGVGAARDFHLTGTGEPERVPGAAVTADYLDTLGIAPLHGRRFARAEDRPGGPAVALIGHAVWMRRFGGEPGAVGRSIEIDGRAHTVVGVLPPAFDMPYGAQIWIPLQLSIDALPLPDRATHGYEMIARLKPGVSRATADRELKGIARRLEREQPQIRRGWSYTLVSLRQQLLSDLEGRTRRSLIAIALAVGFLLLICCANVANLSLARGISREAEMSIRLSLGAGRGRLLRQLATESLLLAALGGAAGIVLAYWATPVLAALNPIRAASLRSLLTDFRIDARVLGVSLALTVVTAVLFGAAPAIRALRSPHLSTPLRGRGERAGGGGSRPLAVLVVAEIAVAMALLAGCGLMVRSFRRLQSADLGFRPDGLWTIEVPLSVRDYPEHRRRVAFVERVLERVRSLPEVRAAGFTTNLPLDALSLDSQFSIEGRPRRNPADVPITGHRLVSPGYAQALGLTLVRGRFLDERDRAEAPPVAVITEELARQAWPGEDPLGKRVRREAPGLPESPWMTVVGVVRDVKEDRFNFRIDRPAWYLPYAQQPAPGPVSLPVIFAVRTDANQPLLAGAVRQIVHSIDTNQPVSAVTTMRSRLSDVLATEHFSAVLMGILGAVGLCLASVGIYGVMAFTVRQRTAEIGLRMALGARPPDIARLVFARGAALLGIGLAVGLPGARALTQSLSGALYRVGAADPATFGTVALLLSAVALAACAIPARRAAAMDPMSALRQD